MRDPQEDKSIMDTAIRSAKLCVCFGCCRPKREQNDMDEFVNFE